MRMMIDAEDTNVIIDGVIQGITQRLSDSMAQKHKEYMNMKDSASYCGLSVAHFAKVRKVTGVEPMNVLGKQLYSREQLDNMMNYFKN